MLSITPPVWRVGRVPIGPMVMLDLELTDPLPETVDLGGRAGVAVLGRVDGRPVLFTMCRLPPGQAVDRDLLGRMLAPKADAIIAALLVPELASSTPPRAAVPTTVAVCTRGRPDDLARCLASIRSLPEADVARADLEVLVVDNAPPDTRTRDLVAALPGVRYVEEPRAGLDFARNRALREARGEVIAYVDDDVEVDRGWLAGLQEALAENPDAQAITGLVLARELDSRAQVIFELRGGFRRGFRKLRYQGQSRPGNPLYPVGAGIFGAGANMAFRRAAVIALGGFDEALDTGPPLPGGGDLEIFYRVICSGAPLVYEPSFLAFHGHRESMDGLRRQYESWGRGFMAFLWKVYAREPDHRATCRRMGRWWLVHMLREVVRSFRRQRPWSPVLPLSEFAGGISGLLGAYPRSARRSAAIRRTHR